MLRTDNTRRYKDMLLCPLPILNLLKGKIIIQNEDTLSCISCSLE